MNRVFRLASVVSFAALLGACEQKGGPVKVDKAEPSEGIVAGGDTVHILGSGFQPGKTQAEVRFGRRKAEQVVIASSNKITVITPPGDKGPADITVSFDDGAQFKIPAGFRFVAPGATEDVRKAFFSGKPGEPKK